MFHLRGSLSVKVWGLESYGELLAFRNAFTFLTPVRKVTKEQALPRAFGRFNPLCKPKIA